MCVEHHQAAHWLAAGSLCMAVWICPQSTDPLTLRHVERKCSIDVPTDHHRGLLTWLFEKNTLPLLIWSRDSFCVKEWEVGKYMWSALRWGWAQALLRPAQALGVFGVFPSHSLCVYSLWSQLGLVDYSIFSFTWGSWSEGEIVLGIWTPHFRAVGYLNVYQMYIPGC